MDSNLIQQALTVSNPQELKPYVNSELDKYELAIKGTKILNATNEEIKQALRFAMILVGVRATTINAIEEEEKEILIEFLREKYPNHTPAEIRIAFTKAAAHELDIKEVAHYENFTCEYLGRIMSAYRKWSSDMNSKINNRKMLEEVETKPQETVVYCTPQQLMDDTFEFWKTSSKKVEYINPKCYDILFKHDYMNLEDEEREQIKLEAKSIVFMYDMPANEKQTKLKDETYLTVLCKKIAVGKFFNKLIEHDQPMLAIYMAV